MTNNPETEQALVTVTQEALLPCPFCGGEELSHGYVSAGGATWGNVECHTCEVGLIGGTEAEAITKWNHREQAQRTEPSAGEVERYAAAIFEADPHVGTTWAEWVAYAEAHPHHMQAVDFVRRQARAIQAMRGGQGERAGIVEFLRDRNCDGWAEAADAIERGDFLTGEDFPTPPAPTTLS